MTSTRTQSYFGRAIAVGHVRKDDLLTAIANAALLVLMVAGQAMSQTSDSFPTTVPQENETVLSNDPSFAEACMAAIAKDVEGRGWRFGNSLLTHSDEFGRIWRIDFDTAGQSDGSRDRVNRVICWQKPGSDDIGVGFSIGQPIARLK